MEKIIERIGKSFSITEFHEGKGKLKSVIVNRKDLPTILEILKKNEGFSHLVLLTAVDWIEKGKFQLTYLLNNPIEIMDLSVQVFIDRENATMESTHTLWQQTATYQRELKEMFGIDFPGSPRVDEPFVLEGWDDIPPYRRDFDTKKYSEETYFPRPGRTTNDPEKYMKEKMYPHYPKNSGEEDV